jgi:hypothetical protein
VPRFIQGQALFAVLGKAVTLVNQAVLGFVINDGQKSFHGHQFRQSGVEAGNHALAVGVVYQFILDNGFFGRHNQ